MGSSNPYLPEPSHADGQTPAPARTPEPVCRYCKLPGGRHPLRCKVLLGKVFDAEQPKHDRRKRRVVKGQDVQIAGGDCNKAGM